MSVTVHHVRGASVSVLEDATTVTIPSERVSVVTVGVAGPQGAGFGAMSPGALIVGGPSAPVEVTGLFHAAAYGATGDGSTDDTTTLQALLTAGAGQQVTIPAPASSYRITAPLTVSSDTVITLAPGTIIEQATTYTPVFDLLDADDVVIRGNGALLRYTGSRAYTGGGSSFRGDNEYAYGAGVWANGNRTRLHDLRVSGFTSGVYLSAWNGTTLGDYAHADNEVHNLVVASVDFGILFGGQVRPVVRNLRGSYSLQTGSPNPSHLIYVTKSGLNRGMDVDGLTAHDGTGGVAFQFKGVQGGKAVNLLANDCAGLLSLEACYDVSVTARARDDDGSGENGSIYFVASTVARCSIDAHLHAADDSTGYRVASIDGTDNIVSIRGRTRQTTTADTYAVEVSGARNTVSFDMANVQNDGTDYTTGRRGVSLKAGSGHTLHIRQARNFKVAFDVVSGVTGCTVALDARRAVPIAAGMTPFNNFLDTDAAFDRNGEHAASITTAGQTVRVDATRYRTSRINVTTADAFTITTPYGPTPRGTRLTYIISNTSGGVMGTITWTGHTVASAWTNPASAQEKSIEFVWDGVRWKEIGRTA
jgi:hypothetical protein